MLTAATIAKIQSALDTLAAIPSARLATSGAATVPLLDLHIKCYYCAAREYTDIGARKITGKVVPAHYYAACEIDGLDVSATGATRAAALRNLFKALHNCALLNEPTLIVPLALREPTKAKAQARAERKANADRAWNIALDRAVTAVEAERAAAPTIIVAASHDAALDVKSEPTRIVCNNLAPRFVEAPIVPADAAPGSEGIFKALLGLRTEEKIVALVNALHAAGVTLVRTTEDDPNLSDDGYPIIRAIMPDYHPQFGTITVLNL